MKRIFLIIIGILIAFFALVSAYNLEDNRTDKPASGTTSNQNSPAAVCR